MDAGPKQDLWNLLPVIIVLLLGAAYFAVMETAFASASRIRLKAAADHGNRRAEQALYVAKKGGKDRYRFYDDSMQGVLSVLSPMDA